MGQQYLASALLHSMEGVYVQPFDFAALLADSSRVLLPSFLPEYNTKAAYRVQKPRAYSILWRPSDRGRALSICLP